MNVREIMISQVHRCGPQDSLETAARQMWEHDCGVLPVVDGEGRAIAVVTDRDICMAAYTRGQPLAAIQVGAAMSRTLAACKADDSLAAAARVMSDHRVRRLPVADAKGHLVGIVSLNDLACAMGEPIGQKHDEITAATLRVLVATSKHRDSVPSVVIPAAAPAVKPAMSEDKARTADKAVKTRI